MTVLDTSGVVDFLVGEQCHAEVADLLQQEGTFAGPDLLVFEVVAVFRRQVQQHGMNRDRAKSAIADLGDLPLEIFPALPLRARVWELRDNLTAADAFFVALAEQLDEPLATKDRHLATAAKTYTSIQIIELGSSGI
ncbi:MAG: type II toxin-antitoxin system VapC family toxin [Acidimicrobiia bacterium]